MIGSLGAATALFQWHVAVAAVEGSIPGWLQRAVAPNRLQNRHGVAATVAGRGACHLATPWKGTWKLSNLSPVRMFLFRCVK